jgi:hypothetical protein
VEEDGEEDEEEEEEWEEEDVRGRLGLHALFLRRAGRRGRAGLWGLGPSALRCACVGVGGGCHCWGWEWRVWTTRLGCAVWWAHRTPAPSPSPDAPPPTPSTTASLMLSSPPLAYARSSVGHGAEAAEAGGTARRQGRRRWVPRRRRVRQQGGA